MNHPTHRALGATATGLTLTGGAGADTLLGSDADDALYGQAGNDLLAGGAGADWMEGGSGNDVYEVDDLNDTVVELAHSGQDRVQASISWHLDRYVEELRLVGDADLTGWGNAGNNRLTGNTGDNLLRGGAGNDALNGLSGTDTLVGGRGDDHYWVDDASDQVIERPTRAGGQDTVTASCTWTLGSGVEALELTGSADLAGYGNSLSNVIVGNAGDNLLWGGSDHGNDTLVGNAGDDMLGSNDGQDWLEGDEGNDWLQAGANDDTLTGGEGNDTLMGGTGNDRYMGDAGDDVLNDGYASASGGGNDTYSFNLGWGHDTLSDVGGQDTVVFGSKEGLSFERTASGGLLISNSLSGDTLLVNNCFIGSPAGVYAVERFEFGDAEALSLADINTLLRTGTDAAQTIYGELTGADWLSAAGGNDTVLALGGNDTVDGGSGDDVLNGGQGQDGLDGGSGNDSLLGDNGADTLLGGTGDDVLYGGNGNDWLNGGAGNDTLAGNLGSDTVVLDILDGSDTVYLFSSGGEDQLRIAQTGLPVGNGDVVLDGAVAQAPGAALQADAELVIVQASARTALTADQLSAALGPADHAFTLGDTRLYALSNGQDTALYYFQAADADAHVAASELTLLATLRSTGTLAVGDVVLGG